MGKSHKKRKRQQQQQQDTKVPSILKQQQQYKATDDISDHDLNITIQTLQTLTPDAFHSKRCKLLRQTLHPWIVSYMRETYDIDYRAKVTLALQRNHWAEASRQMIACREFAQIPKPGTIQRWVRDCNHAPSAIQMRLLQLILTLQQNNHDDDTNCHNPSTALAQLASESPDITILEAWKWWEEEEDGRQSPPDRPTTVPSVDLTAARVVYREEASTRTPPNHYDLILHGNVNIVWEPASPLLRYCDIPFLPKPSRMLPNALSVTECQQLIQLLTQLNFRPDHPVDAESSTGIDSCEIMMTDGTLFERVRNVLPETLPVQGTTVRLHSINARWRGFRYTPNCTYRPHLDGSWPHTYMRDDSYHCDHSSPIKSYLTFLLYLNDDFEGGDTRFYLPHQVARGIAPRTGSVLVFPQGNVASLIHEGSSVTSKDGVKYVIRTDVLYAPDDKP